MELALHSIQGNQIANIEITDAVFAQQFNEPLIHQVVVAYLAAGRAGTKAQKTRAEVSGGGRKPWRQKGTGRARAGTTRSPLWRGGGRTFAARPQDHSQKVNRKMYRGAMRSILSELINQQRLIVINEIQPNTPKTKNFLVMISAITPIVAEKKNISIITEVLTENLYLATRNLFNVNLIESKNVDPVSLINSEKVIITLGALRQIEERLI